MIRDCRLIALPSSSFLHVRSVLLLARIRAPRRQVTDLGGEAQGRLRCEKTACAPPLGHPQTTVDAIHACGAAQRGTTYLARTLPHFEIRTLRTHQLGLRGVRCFEGFEFALARPFLLSARARMQSISPLLGIAQWRRPSA